jgi:DNA-binding NtrC family response regulator
MAEAGATPKTRVLIAEDDASARRGLIELVRSWGFAAEGAADGETALERVTSFRPSIVLADLVMPRKDGLGLLRALQLQGDLGDLTFVMITGQGSIDTAVAAMKEGAFDYLTKPVDPRRLRLLLDKVVERQDTLREVRALRQQLHSVGQFGRIIGNSPAIRAIYRIIEQAAPTEASILICGESGTGKELAARTIHQLSGRAAQPFVGLN